MKRAWMAVWTALWSMGLAVVHGQGIRFETGDFQAAQAKAGKEGKMVMLFVCTGGMEACTIMESAIFPSEAVGKAYQPHFICWKLEASELEANPFFAGVRILSVPEFIFFDAKGNPQYREKGLHDAAAMLSMAAAARDPHNHLSQWQKRYAAGNREPDFVQRYILAMDAAGNDMVAPSRDYLHSLPKEELFTTENWIIATIGLQDVDAPAFRYICDHKADFATAFGEDNVGAFFLQAYRTSLGIAIQKQQASLLMRCRELLQEITDPASAQTVHLQGELAYHAEGKNWRAYENAARSLLATYKGDDAVLYNDVAWTLAEHGEDTLLLRQAEGWARKSVELQPETWNWHTLASLQLRNGDPAAAEKSAEASLHLSKPGSEEATEAKKLLDRIRNSR